MTYHAYRHIRAPNRPGRPKIHWAESCMAQAAQRIDHLMSDQAPTHDHIHHSCFDIPSSQQVRHAHRASGLVWMDKASLFRYVHPRCQDRTLRVRKTWPIGKALPRFWLLWHRHVCHVKTKANDVVSKISDALIHTLFATSSDKQQFDKVGSTQQILWC